MTSCNYGCHGNQLDTTWLRSIKSTKEAHYISVPNIMSTGKLCRKGRGPIDPPPPLPSCNFFGLCPLELINTDNCQDVYVLFSCVVFVIISSFWFGFGF